MWLTAEVQVGRVGLEEHTEIKELVSKEKNKKKNKTW